MSTQKGGKPVIIYTFLLKKGKRDYLAMNKAKSVPNHEASAPSVSIFRAKKWLMSTVCLALAENPEPLGIRMKNKTCPAPGHKHYAKSGICTGRIRQVQGQATRHHPLFSGHQHTAQLLPASQDTTGMGRGTRDARNAQ